MRFFRANRASSHENSLREW